jgi:DNA-binding HxlR family transcriptional regulator
MKRSSLAARHCPVARAGAELLDAWTFMILREVFLSNRRFDGIQEQTGMSPRSLTMRLGSLVDSGILKRSAYQYAPLRYEYRLTPKGLDLWPLVMAMKQWGEKWKGPWPKEGPALQLFHRGRGHELQLRSVCSTCGETVDAFSADAHIGKHMARERKAMALRHAARKSGRTS